MAEVISDFNVESFFKNEMHSIRSGWNCMHHKGQMLMKKESLLTLLHAHSSSVEANVQLFPGDNMF